VQPNELTVEDNEGAGNTGKQHDNGEDDEPHHHFACAHFYLGIKAFKDVYFFACGSACGGVHEKTVLNETRIILQSFGVHRLYQLIHYVGQLYNGQVEE